MSLDQESEALQHMNLNKEVLQVRSQEGSVALLRDAECMSAEGRCGSLPGQLKPCLAGENDCFRGCQRTPRFLHIMSRAADHSHEAPGVEVLKDWAC